MLDPGCLKLVTASAKHEAGYWKLEVGCFKVLIYLVLEIWFLISQTYDKKLFKNRLAQPEEE